MKEITINELQMVDAGAIIRVSEELLQRYRDHLNESTDWEHLTTYRDLVDEEERKLQMAYSLLRALGLSYDADTYRITKREEVEQDA